jgi:AhpD family alkylhydroperoxidase
MRLTPALGVHLRGLADQVLVDDYPGATITRAQREMIATAVSAANDCFFCMDSHAAHATALLERDGAGADAGLLETLKLGGSDGFDAKMQALLRIARVVREDPRALTPAHVETALAARASDADVQLAVLIAAAFSMYNRIVDGFRARTPGVTDVYASRAAEIAQHGYAAPPPAAPSGTNTG